MKKIFTSLFFTVGLFISPTVNANAASAKICAAEGYHQLGLAQQALLTQASPDSSIVVVLDVSESMKGENAWLNAREALADVQNHYKGHLITLGEESKIYNLSALPQLLENDPSDYDTNMGAAFDAVSQTLDSDGTQPVFWVTDADVKLTPELIMRAKSLRGEHTALNLGTGDLEILGLFDHVIDGMPSLKISNNSFEIISNVYSHELNIRSFCKLRVSAKDPSTAAFLQNAVRKGLFQDINHFVILNNTMIMGDDTHLHNLLKEWEEAGKATPFINPTFGSFEAPVTVEVLEEKPDLFDFKAAMEIHENGGTNPYTALNLYARNLF